MALGHTAGGYPEPECPAKNVNIAYRYTKPILKDRDEGRLGRDGIRRETGETRLGVCRGTRHPHDIAHPSAIPQSSTIAEPFAQTQHRHGKFVL